MKAAPAKQGLSESEKDKRNSVESRRRIESNRERIAPKKDKNPNYRVKPKIALLYSTPRLGLPSPGPRRVFRSYPQKPQSEPLRAPDLPNGFFFIDTAFAGAGFKDSMIPWRWEALLLLGGIKMFAVM